MSDINPEQKKKEQPKKISIDLLADTKSALFKFEHEGQPMSFTVQYTDEEWDDIEKPEDAYYIWESNKPENQPEPLPGIKWTDKILYGGKYRAYKPKRTYNEALFKKSFKYAVAELRYKDLILAANFFNKNAADTFGNI